MVKPIDTALISLRGDTVGAVAWLSDKGYGVFEYDTKFLKLGLNLSPIHMPLEDAIKGQTIFSFPGLQRETFLGLPGMLADALPDKFGNRIIDAWLANQGRDQASFNPVERLCYTGKRAMGALEFSPCISTNFDQSVTIEISDMVSLAQQILKSRSDIKLQISNNENDNAEAIMDILRVGTSAGGARAKAVIALNDDGHVLSGQTEAPKGFDYWLLKFDGVTDLELGETRGYGRIEYAYAMMAKQAGIQMAECRLLEENGRAHFMSKRFDRHQGQKIHMQSLCALGHYDFNQAGAYSYEDAFTVMRRLRLNKAAAIEQYRRMLFNVFARNQDDHTKNIAFLMDENGQWQLSPAFDMTYAHNPGGLWTSQHQMSLNGKRDNFTLQDLTAVGESISLPSPKHTIEEVANAINNWPKHAKNAGVQKKVCNEISKQHRLDIIQ